ncbi:hypothetical protein [Burkholderia gladioli]|uniref:hypothetical protein n=1 Tax=Burkholderia gladioli TaxID=28095 RepID=UPI00163EC1C9|nr:hypothetical protein [Burkholderia gladioli]
MTEQKGAEGQSVQVFLVFHLTDLRAAADQEREHNYERLDAQRDHRKAAALFMESSQKTGYELVGRVTAADVDAVSFLTTSVDRPWWLNNGVEAKFDGRGCRSIDMGDIAIDRFGRAYVCSTIGWDEIGLFPEKAHLA